MQQEGQALQLRLTITAADRALLRDKLAEAEQQLASYQSILREYEAEKEELYDTAYSLYSKVLKLTEQNHAAATEMQQLKSKLSACFSGSSLGTPQASAIATESMIGRGSHSASSSPEPPRNGGASILARPRSAAAIVGPRTAGQQLPGFTATAGGAAAGQPLARYIPSPVQNTSSNIGLGRTLPRSPSQSSGVGVSSLNPICISSPFGDTADAAAAAVSGVPSGIRRVRPSRTVSGGSSVDGSPGGSPSPSVSPTPALLSTALSTGTSRIPLPPCLQQRPKQLQTSDVRLLRFATGQSKLPGAPNNSSSSSVASSMGGVLLSSNSSSNYHTWSGIPPYSTLSTVGGADSPLLASTAAGVATQQQLQLSTLGRPPAGNSSCIVSTNSHRPSNLGEGTINSPNGLNSSSDAAAAAEPASGQKLPTGSLASALLCPANRLKSQPGLLAVAAAVSEDGSSIISSSGLAGLATEAATGEDFKKLWQGLPQAGMVVRISDEGGDATAGGDFRIPAGNLQQ